MANEDVQLTFGANTAQFTAALKSVQGQIGQLQGYVGQLAGYFGQLNNIGTLVAGTLATLGLESFVRKMVESGVETERMAISLGVTVTQLTRIKAAAGLAGVDADRLALTLERLSLNVQRSTRDAFSPQSEALKVLGLRAKDLIGLSADQYFDKLAAAASKFNPSLNLTNALMQLGGKSMADMVAAFVRGGAEFKSLIDSIAKANAYTAQFAQAADETHLKLGYMDAVVSGLSKRMFVELKPAIDAIIESNRIFVQSINKSIDSGGAWSLVLKAVGFFLKDLYGIILLVNLALMELAAVAKFSFDTIKNHGIPNIKELKDQTLEALDAYKKSMDRLTGVTTETKNFADAMKSAREELAKMLTGLRGTESAVGTFADRWHQAMVALGKEAKPLDFEGRERLQMMQAQMESEIKLRDSAFEHESLLLERSLLLNQTTEARKVQAVGAASQARYADQVALLQKEMALEGLKPPEIAKIQAQIKEVEAKAANERLKTQTDYMKQVQGEWKEVIDTLQNSWDNQLRGLLQGTTSWKNAMKGVFTDLVLFAIKKFEELLIIKPILAALSDSFSPATFFSDIFAVIKKLIGQVFTGATAFFAPELGPAAPAAGAAVAAATEAAALSYDTGAWSVPQTAHALVHRDEMILPVDFASAVRSALTGGAMGGASNLTLSLQAWDAASVQRWLRSGGADMLARAVSAQYNQNPTIRPRY
jgi:hypothetical protein